MIPRKQGRFMQIRSQIQQASVADDFSALVAVVRPILEGLLYALKMDVVTSVGGYYKITLKLLPRLYRKGDRDCGICFEYAVHDAIMRKESKVIERVSDALDKCNVYGASPTSILFGLEKAGALDLINSVKEQLTEDSRLMAGVKGQPAKLKRHIDSIASAFRKRKDGDGILPYSISGLWKADLFLGKVEPDKWVGTTVKINVAHLEGAKGLRVGVVPTLEGKSDAVRMDESKNLVICPLPYDAGFMEIFYSGWLIVQQFINADAYVPKEIALPRQVDRAVARQLEDRREFMVLDVIETLKSMSQPELLMTEETSATLVSRREASVENETGAVIAPLAKS